ncbi:ABC transporter permease [Microbacterium sp. RD1]|uniref:ABC transporter permease n=1 Tax=Microbacterium sp. RD1 TaxID=3457313 RepID=UPI003FA59C9C
MRLTTTTTLVTASARSRRGRIVSLWPIAFAVGMLIVLFVIPTLSGRSVTIFSVYNSLQSYAALGLVALALGLTMIIGEFDLSVVGTYALGGMIAVKLGGENPIYGALAALVVCGAFGALQGFLVARFAVNSMAVTLAGYLVALGATGTIGDNRSQPYANFDVTGALNSPFLGVFSLRSGIAIVVIAALAALFLATPLGRDLRATGGGRRASRTAGVRVTPIVIGTFATSGMLAALGGTLQSYGVATAASNPGLSPLIFAVTAALLGGIALTGGRGTPVGIAAGALGLCFLSQLFTDMVSPQYVTSLVTGTLLVIVTVFATPVVLRNLARARQVRTRQSAA